MGTKGRLMIYPRAESMAFVKLVKKMIGKLERPICSADIRVFLRSNPEVEIGLVQRAGQLLAKAARPRPNGFPRLWRVARVGGRTYYGLENGQHWKAVLEQHHADLIGAYLINQEFPLLLPMLRGAGRHDFAAAAAWGWNFFAQWVQNRGDKGPARLLDRLLRMTEGFPACTGVPSCGEGERLTPAHAKKRMALEADSRMPGVPMNLNRHMARMLPPLLWNGPKFYSREQVMAYCQWHWPMEGDQPRLAQAISQGWSMILSAQSWTGSKSGVSPNPPSGLGCSTLPDPAAGGVGSNGAGP